MVRDSYLVKFQLLASWRDTGGVCQTPASLPKGFKTVMVVMITLPACGLVVPSRKISNTWLSTGWFTMTIALELCDRINVYGMVPPDFCR